jgi:hypothetical protein
VPGAVRSAYTPYSKVKLSRPWESPTAQKIQPSGFRGRWVATSAPTTGNEIASMAGGVTPIRNASIES